MPRFSTVEIYERWMMQTALLETWNQVVPEAKRTVEQHEYVDQLRQRTEKMIDHRPHRARRAAA
jgi:uncharacterized coiled-coil protein SlyX